MKSIKTLLNSGNITGDEIGRLVLSDYASVMNALFRDEEVPKSRFTDAELQMLLNKLDNPHRRTYNEYIGLLNFLKKLAQIHRINVKDITFTVIALSEYVKNTRNLKTVQALTGGEVTMTEKQYNRLKEEDLQQKLTVKTSVGGIILKACDYYARSYFLDQRNRNDRNSGEGAKEEAGSTVSELLEKHPDKDPTMKVGEIIGDELEALKDSQPYADLFRQYASKLLTNPKFRENYYRPGENGHYVTPDGRDSREIPSEEWSEIVSQTARKGILEDVERPVWVDDGRHAPDDATKLDILEYVEGFFSIGAEASKEDIETFKSDYPELYEAILTELQQIKGLELPSDHAEQSISHETLYTLNLPYYAEYFRYNPVDSEGSFVAQLISVIPQEQIDGLSKWQKKTYLDKDGNYKYETGELKTYVTIGREYLEKLAESFRLLLAEKEVYDMVARITGLKAMRELGGLPFIDEREGGKIDDTLIVLNFINSEIDELKSDLRSTSPVMSKETVDEVHELIKSLSEINLKELQPTPERIRRARQLARSVSYFDLNGLHLLDYLQGLIQL